MKTRRLALTAVLAAIVAMGVSKAAEPARMLPARTAAKTEAGAMQQVQPLSISAAKDLYRSLKKKPLSARIPLNTTYYSTDKTDFDPVVGTVWEFYRSSDGTYFNSLLADTQYQIDSSDNSVYLTVWDDQRYEGLLFYTDLSIGGRGFAAIVTTPTDYTYYEFQVEEDVVSATGAFHSEEKGSGILSDLIPVQGLMIYGPYSLAQLNRAVERDGDGKLGLSDIIYLLQMMSGFR